MKKHTFLLSLATIFTVLSLLMLFMFVINKIRWDKVPLIGYFVLEINLYPADMDASYLTEPIKWYQLDEAPDDFDAKGSGSWFAINPYTLNLLKEYMRTENLGIVPDRWNDLQITSDFEECLDIFEFVQLGEPLKTENKGNITAIVMGGFAIVLWILFIYKTKARYG